MTAKLVVLYPPPADVVEFDRRYHDEHVPLAGKIPNVQRAEFARGQTGVDGSDPAYHLVAELYFEDAATLQSALGSAEGQAAAGHAQEISPDVVFLVTELET